MIVKKFKYFQRKKDGYSNRRWTFQGSQPDTGADPTSKVSRYGEPSGSATQLQQYYSRTYVSESQLDGFQIDSVPDSQPHHQNQLFESESLDSLIDIRESIAY